MTAQAFLDDAHVDLVRRAYAATIPGPRPDVRADALSTADALRIFDRAAALYEQSGTGPASGWMAIAIRENLAMGAT